MASRIKGGIKKRETDPASNQCPKCSPTSGTHRDSQSWVEKRRGREETEVAQRVKGGESKGERQIQPVISSLCVLHHPEHTSDSQSWVEKRRGREETEVT